MLYYDSQDILCGYEYRNPLFLRVNRGIVGDCRCFGLTARRVACKSVCIAFLVRALILPVWVAHRLDSWRSSEGAGDPPGSISLVPATTQSGSAVMFMSGTGQSSGGIAIQSASGSRAGSSGIRMNTASGSTATGALGQYRAVIPGSAGRTRLSAGNSAQLGAVTV